MAEFVQNNMNFIGLQRVDAQHSAIRVLDYACGPGTMTDVFLQHATELVGLDISQKMIERYNKTFEINNKVSGFVANLLDPDGLPEIVNEAKFKDFDLVVISGGFHHFPDIDLATRRLVERLRSGGKLLILDFVQHQPDDIGDHPAAKTITRHGFGEDEMKQLLGHAGLKNVDFLESTEILHFNGISRTPFLARGTK